MQTDSTFTTEPRPQISRDEPRTGFAGTRSALIAGVLTWSVCAAYLLPFVNRGWFAHDDGLLGHTAERVLNGELPHRDFDACYTGGLASLHAFSFHIFGINLSTMRWLLYGASLAFIPFLYLIALRCCSPVMAGLVTLTCFAWSVPNYFAAMPSWYILFLTVAAIYCLIRFSESNSRYALLLAGICCGLAMLAKINGLFSVAACLLFILYHNQSRSSVAASDVRSGLVGWATSGICLAYCTLVFLLLRRGLDAGTLINLLAPNIAVGVFLSWNEWANGRGQFSDRSRLLVKDVSVYVAGVALPVMLFVIPYIATDSLPDLAYGLFVLPQKRFEWVATAEPFPPSLLLVVLVPLALLLLSRLMCPDVNPVLHRRLMVSVLCVLVAATSAMSVATIYNLAWSCIRLSAPLAVLVTAIVLVRHSKSIPDKSRKTLVLLMLAAAALSLIQFPFAARIYFCYSASIIILMVVYLQSLSGRSGLACQTVFLVFLLSFAVWSQSNHYAYCAYPVRDEGPVRKLATMELERGSLVLESGIAACYQELVDVIQRHTREGDSIFAAPDCPEVYFLANRRNPTRTMYDLFDPVRPEDRARQVMEMLVREDISVVVVNMSPAFSETLNKPLQGEIRNLFPQLHAIGPFIVATRMGENESSMDQATRRSPTVELQPLKLHRPLTFAPLNN
jgi:hypothetical protein